VDADGVVDDELQTGQADAGIGQSAAKAKARSGLPTFIMILTGISGMAELLDDLGRSRMALVDEAGVALGAAHGDRRRPDAVGGVAAADHGRDAQLARDDGRVAGAPAAVGDDGAARFITGSQSGRSCR
jgi:hypothetical protein